MMDKLNEYNEQQVLGKMKKLFKMIFLKFTSNQSRSTALDKQIFIGYERGENQKRKGGNKISKR